MLNERNQSIISKVLFTSFSYKEKKEVEDSTSHQSGSRAAETSNMECFVIIVNGLSHYVSNV